MKAKTTLMSWMFGAVLVLGLALISSTTVAQTAVLLAEGFEGGTAMPAGWTQENLNGTTLWQAVAATTGTPPTAGAGAYKARFYNTSGHRTLLITPVINFTGYTEDATLKFWHTQRVWAGDQDILRVWYRTSSTASWVLLVEYLGDVTDWTQRTIPLPNVNSTYQIAFDATGNYGYGVQLDEVEVSGSPAVQGVPMTVQVGDGTMTSNYPFTTFWHDGRTQMLYPAGDLIAAGALPGELVQMAFNIISNSTQPMNGFSVKVQHSALTAAPTAFVESGWTEVFFGTYTVLGTGWRDITFQTPFVWDGLSNLLFEICYDNTSWTSYSPVFATATPVATMRGQYTDGAIGCALAAGSNFTYRPNVRLTFLVPPGILQGIVADAFTGNPITGAVVSVGDFSATTLANGAFSMFLPAGPVSISCEKTGYETQVISATVIAEQTTTVNIFMYENTNPPGAVLAVLNAAQTAVNLSWSVPTGPYEIIYDDGTPENIVAWSTGGNINALRFTPLAYPVQIIGGSIHIGDGSYPPAQTNPKPFEVAIYNQDNSPFGWPNQELARVEVNPTEWGWVSFTLSQPVVINDGDFYIGMIQGGNFPNCSPIGVDETNPGMRSYSRFASGNGPWTIAGFQDFMIRAIVNGPGGPWPNMVASNFIEAQRPHQDVVSLKSPKSIRGAYVSEAKYAPFLTTLQPAPGTEDISAFRNENIRSVAASRTSVLSSGQSEETGNGVPSNLPATVSSSAGRGVLFHNGPLVNSPGTGFGGADESVLQSPITTYGYNFNFNSNFMIADDFTVTGDEPWVITSVELFGYQTGGPTTSTMTGGYVRIWNGSPANPTSAVIWGDLTTNLMTSTSFTNIYRTNQIGQNIVNRPIMSVICSTPGLILDPGTYFVEFATTGSIASGPWISPVTISGQPETGNALRLLSGEWQPMLSADIPQGAPFVIYGDVMSDLEYKVFRMEQGQEGNEMLWDDLGIVTGNSYVDNQWTSLNDGAYRWAVKAKYLGDRYSHPTFSNVLGKGFTVDAVTFNLSLSSGNTPSGIEVVMVNQNVPDTTYTAVTGPTGVIAFNNVWKGTYDITVYKFGFELWERTEAITANKTYNIMLMQLKNPPRSLFVNNRTLMANWQPPIMQALMLEETFSSSSFATNQWTSEPNWAVAFTGNPSPSAQFNWSPSITNYSRSLTSKPLMGVGAPNVWFEYDVFLSNFSVATIEKLAAEVWNGSEWVTIKTYDNQGGNIAWTSESFDITQYAVGEFRIRFRAYGANSFNINNWNIDNVRVVGVETDFSVMGYNFYVNDLQVGFVTQTEFQIPPILITYGQTYLAEVNAVYQSGLSQRIGYTFTSFFLPKPNNLQGMNVEDAVQLTWEAPFIPIDRQADDHNAFASDDFPRGLYPPSIGAPPADGVPTAICTAEPVSLKEFFRGTTAWGINNSAPAQIVSFDTDAPQTLTNLGAFPQTGFSNAGDFPLNESGFIYELENNGSFKKITLEPFNIQVLGTIPGDWVGMATNPTNGTIYGITPTALYIIDPVAVSSTFVGQMSTSGLQIALAIDGEGNAWSYDLMDDSFYSINLQTGARTLVGSIGFDANFGQGMTWDKENDRILMAAFNNGTFQAELRVVNRATGATTLIGPIGSSFPGGTVQMAWIAMPYMMGGAAAEGLIGYNIYRDNAFHAYVDAPELEFWDLNMMPGQYKYTATAVYDLTVFGLTGTDESIPSNEVNIGVNNFGYPLPFVEEWNSANFTFNNWVVSNSDPHWRVTTAQGNPVPAAEFTWSPPVKEYEIHLTSPPINAALYNCAEIFIDFHIRLNDRNATGDEKLALEVFLNNNWVKVKEFANTGSFNWTPQSVNVSMMQGKTFLFRFVASGKNTADILSWFIDNVHVYAECNPPLDLSGVQIGGSYNAYLEWAEPDCESGASGTLVKLSQWDGPPTNAYFQQYNYAYGVVYNLSQYPDATLELVDFHHASWGVLGTWQYKIHVINWSNYQIIATIGPLTTTGNDKWENGLQLGEIMGYGGGLIGIMLEPLSNSPTDAYPCFSGDNIGPNGLSLWGQIPNFSAFATSTVGDFMQNLWIRTNFAKSSELVKLEPVTTIEEIAETRAATSKAQNIEGLVQHSRPVPSFDNATFKDSPVQGYNVYRSHDDGITFDLISPSPVTTLSYTDMDVTPGDYIYQVKALYAVCESVPATFPLSITVGIDEVSKDGVSVYPVPATSFIIIAGTENWRQIRLINYLGQMVYENRISGATHKIDVSELMPGAYTIQLRSDDGTSINRRILIVR